MNSDDAARWTVCTKEAEGASLRMSDYTGVLTLASVPDGIVVTTEVLASVTDALGASQSNEMLDEVGEWLRAQG
jgi:hypothetical protein